MTPFLNHGILEPYRKSGNLTREEKYLTAYISAGQEDKKIQSISAITVLSLGLG